MLGSSPQHSFAQIPSVNIQRSQFDRSFSLKDTFDFDYLVPIFVDEILPGDTANVNVNTFARLATQKVPIMDNMYIDYFFFFVPNRLLMTNWEKLMGARDNPGDSISFILPTLTTTAGGPEVGTIYDKMGLPTDVANAYTIKNTLPLRAYNLIWNEWFRDQNLQNSVIKNVDDGPDIMSDYALLKRNKKHDYFTSALPTPQRGVAVTLPLGSSAPLTRVSNAPVATLFQAGTNTTFNSQYLRTNNTGQLANDALTASASIDLGGSMVADLSAATASTINQLREAYAMQSLFELDARGGTRLTEIIATHFNVTVPDFRLQRPEYLGGGSSRINSHPVPQATPTTGTQAQASLAAYGTSSTMGQSVGFTKSFVEHGYVIGLACARADITYQQGLNKLWNRSTRYDFYWPELANLGEQSILNKELYLQGTASDESVFGYQERYAEYRYKPSEIHGEFRSTYSTPLDMWHMSEEFSALPALNATFIQQSTPIERAIAVTTEPHLLFDAYFNYKHARPLPVYSVPSHLGRF